MKAKKYFEVAAAQGDSRAQLQLAMLEAEQQQTEQVAAVSHLMELMFCLNCSNYYVTRLCMEQEEETAAARARGDAPPVPASDADAKALIDAAVCFLLCQAQRVNCSSRA